jgi:hypothetical protein
MKQDGFPSCFFITKNKKTLIVPREVGSHSLKRSKAMKFQDWMLVVLIHCNTNCVLNDNELLAAYHAGRDPIEVAQSNDTLVSEYQEVYGLDWELVAA